MFPLFVLALVLLVAALADAQRRYAFSASRDHPAIAYSSGPTTDAVAALDQRLQDGAIELHFEPHGGYLRSVLEALDVPEESQTLVFSQTSLQAPLINFHNPRAVYFNDTVAVGWVRGGDILEVAVHDPQQGVIFYSLDQTQGTAPRFVRDNTCLACHLSWETLAVPGLMVQSMYPLRDERSYAVGFTTIHGSPLEQRWGGWWVTGDHGGAAHIGNVPVMPADKGLSRPANPTAVLPSVEGWFDLDGFPSAHSDVVALLVLAHQTHMTNLITRAGWEARVAAAEPGPAASDRVAEAVQELVDYMLFVDEAPLAGPVKGSSGFTEQFAARGPHDRQKRSLREFDLRTRLFRYPVSYMIYSEAFDALPALVKDAVYARIWEILSGQDKQPRYQLLTPSEREAILQILRDTKRDLPPFFRAAARTPEIRPYLRGGRL
jgi:hypothetical protein